MVGFAHPVDRSMGSARHAAAFTKGLSEPGYVEGQNVIDRVSLAQRAKTIACRRSWLTSCTVALQLSLRLAILSTLAAKAATTTIPIDVWLSVETRSGMGWSPALPGQAATRLALIFLPRRSWPSGWGCYMSSCPKPSVLSSWSTRPMPRAPSSTLRSVPEAARALGLQIQVLHASTSRDIEAAFATIVSDRADALFVGPDGFFNSRRVQFATLATRYGIPAAYASREIVEVGGLMSYGTDLLDMYRQVGVYAGRILKGAKPADLPVVQSTKFELVINLQTARALGLDCSADAARSRRRGDRMMSAASSSRSWWRGGGVAACGARAAAGDAGDRGALRRGSAGLGGQHGRIPPRSG